MCKLDLYLSHMHTLSHSAKCTPVCRCISAMLHNHVAAVSQCMLSVHAVSLFTFFCSASDDDDMGIRVKHEPGLTAYGSRDEDDNDNDMTDGDDLIKSKFGSPSE